VRSLSTQDLCCVGVGMEQQEPIARYDGCALFTDHLKVFFRSNAGFLNRGPVDLVAGHRAFFEDLEQTSAHGLNFLQYMFPLRQM